MKLQDVPHARWGYQWFM